MITVIQFTLLQAAPRPFDSVFSGNIKGDLVMAGNSNILQSAWMDNPNPASIDGDDTDLCLERSTGGELCRNNSSSALLDVPDNARIVEARLYVQTTLNPDVEPVQVRIAGPDDGFDYATAPNAEISKLYEATAGTSPGNYPRDSMRSAVFDVTDLVQTQGGGDYTIADIVYERDGSTWMPYAGWTIMVAYEWDDTSGVDLNSLSPEEQYRYKLRSVSWSDGMLYQTSGTTTVTLDNFQVPDSGPKFGKTFHSVAHGQLGYADALDFNGQPLGDNNASGNSENPFETIGSDPMCNTTTDVQNDTMCYLGSHVDTKSPGADAYTASGDNSTVTSSTSIDADVIRIPDSYLTPGLTSAEVSVRTIGDEWLTPAMLAISVDLPEEVSLPEFECTATGYLFQTGGGPTSAYAVNLLTGEYETAGNNFFPGATNAYGYNTEDNYIYGIQQGANSGVITRVGSDFTTETLGRPSNWSSYPFLNSKPFNSGAFDDNGMFWIVGGAHDQSNVVTWAQIDLNPTSDTYMEIMQAGTVGPFSRTISDIVYNPQDGHLYTIADRTGGVPNFALWRFNTTSLEIEDTGVLIPGSVVSGGVVGAQFSDADGFLYASSNNSGEIMRVDMDTGQAEPFANGPSSTGNDGASCVLAHLYADYGDAPASYGTLLEDDGARHGLADFDEGSNTAPLMLGEGVSAENDGQPSAGADADTFDDGVSGSIVLAVDQPTEVDVSVTNNTDEVATLAGWIDLNGNGTFDAGERVTVEVPANSGTTTQTLTFPAVASVSDDTYARFRVFPGEVADPLPTGSASAGEVEDYTVQLASVRYQKSVDPIVSVIEPEQTFTYTITVENIGGSDLTDLSFTDNLADVVDDATYNSDVSADIGTATFNSPDEIAWSGDLAIGQTATITFSVTMNDPVSGNGVLINSVVGDGPGSNCVEDPAVDPDCTTTIPLPDVSSEKTLIGPANPQPGDTVEYQFVITNEGDAAVSGITAADDLSGILDDAAYNNDAAATVGSVSFNAANQRLNWSGSLAASGDAGDTATITYSVTVNDASDLGDGILRNGLIAPGCPNPPIFDVDDPDFNADCVTETPIQAWMATKSVSPSGTVAPGETLNYTIQVDNVGGADLTGLNVDDDLSDVLDDATYNNDEEATEGSASYAEPTLSWTGDLDAGQSATITYSATVNDIDDLGDGVLSNVITGAPNCPADECETETPVSALTIQKESSPAGPVEAGDEVTYTVTVENVGGVEVEADFTDTLTEVLDDATYNDDLAATEGTATYNEPIISWEGSLAPDQTATITYSVTVNDAGLDGDGVMTNAVVSPAAGCPSPAVTNPEDPDFDADCVTVTPVSEWIATKSVTPEGTATPGQTVTYNVVIENIGGADLIDLTVADDLTDVLDDATYNDDETASVGDASYSEPTLTWEGDLAQGESAILSYSVTVNEAGDLGDGILNNVITGPMNCPGADCETETPVEAWSATKAVSPEGAVNPGDVVTYTLDVVNNGATDLTGLSVDDDLSNVLDDASYNNDGDATVGSVGFDAPTLTWNGDLAAGQSSTVTYSITINSADSLGDGILNNVITGAPNCPAADCVTETPIQAWMATKSVSPSGTVAPGETLNYTIQVDNVGGADLTGLNVDDDLSDVLDDATYNNDEEATEGSASYAEPTLSWTGDLDAGQSATITYSATVNDIDDLGDGVLSNVITGAPNCPADECETETPVEAWSATKAVSPEGAVNPGDVVTYTLDIVNNGATDLTGLSVDDNLSGVLDDASYNSDGDATVGSVSFDDPTLTWSGDLAAGQSSTVTYSITVNSADSLGDGILNNVITGAPNCPADECETENPIQAWVARKTVAPGGGVDPGDVVNFTVTVENTGGADLTGADAPSIQDDMTDVLDDAVYNNDEAATIGTPTYTEPVIDWSDDLLVGESSDITYSVTVNDAEELGNGVLNNIVTGAPNCPADECETTTHIATFEVEKTSDPEDGSEVTAGESVTYTVTIHNTGTLALTDFSFDDNLSGVLNNATFVGDPTVSPADAGTAVLNDTALSFTGDIPVGQTVAVSYTVRVNDDAPAGVELRNIVTGEFSNCVTGEEPECLTTHTVVDGDDPSGVVPGIEDLAETGQGLLLFVLGAIALIATGFGVMKLAPRYLNR